MDALTRYRTYLYAAGRAESTIRLRLAHLKHLQARHPDLLTVREEQLVAFLAHLRTRGVGPEARKNYRASLRSFYQWVCRTGLTPCDPAYLLDPIPIPHTVARACPDSVLLQMIPRCTLPERAMIYAGRYGALRLSEIASLHTDRMLPGNVLLIRGKGSKERHVPASPMLAVTLTELERETGGGYYFPGRFGGHLHPHSVNKIITRRLGWNPHSLRHAGATAAYNRTHDLRAVQVFLGHASIATTQRYLGVSLDAVRRVADATEIVWGTAA